MTALTHRAWVPEHCERYIPQLAEANSRATTPEGGAILMLHLAGKRKKERQISVKLVFDVEDVPAFLETCRTDGLTFGPMHQADGYAFANAKDPSGNSSRCPADPLALIFEDYRDV